MLSIECRDVWKSFDRKRVLRGVNLMIEPGETLVIMGQSGTGKSVLLKHFVGLLAPDHGVVLVDGQDVARLSRKKLFELRMRFGMVFQGAALFDSDTVLRNVGLALREHTDMTGTEIRAIVNEKLQMVGLEGVGDKYPAELSGGMKKRVGFARAIAMNPECVLYDEPTTGLDPIMADVINSLIIMLADELKITSVVVTHDLASAYKVADRIAMLHEGVIIFTGTPDEIRKTDNPSVQQFIEGRAHGPIVVGEQRVTSRGLEIRVGAVVVIATVIAVRRHHVVPEVPAGGETLLILRASSTRWVGSWRAIQSSSTASIAVVSTISRWSPIASWSRWPCARASSFRATRESP